MALCICALFDILWVVAGQAVNEGCGVSLKGMSVGHLSFVHLIISSTLLSASC